MKSFSKEPPYPLETKMDERMATFLEFITAHELESYLSKDGLKLIDEMRKKWEEERYENWLDQCEDFGIDREFARSISRRS